MKKIFQQRGLLKPKIHNKQVTFYVNEREVWYIHLGVNIGFEEDGKWGDSKRPVLIIKKVGNLFFVVPLTTKGKDNNIFYHRINDGTFEVDSRAILSQVKMIDKNRCIEIIGELSKDDFIIIKKKLKVLLWL
jgi:mRNA interferase MazF